MKTAFRALAWTAAILAVIAGILYAFVFDVWTMPDDDPAMLAAVAPTLAGGDVVLVSRHSSPQPNQLLRCADPDAPGRFVVAREAGKEGQKIEISRDVLTVDGTRGSVTGCDDPSATIESPTTHAATTLLCARTDSGGVSHELLRGTEDFEDDRTAVVSLGRIYLVSDDLHFHVDSRDYGEIDPATCQHLVFRLVSAAGIGDRPRRFTLLW